MKRHALTTLVLAGALGLTGCGGGGGAPTTIGTVLPDEPPLVSAIGWLVDVEAARSLAGGTVPPALTSTQIREDLRTKTEAADSLLMSDVVGATGAGVPFRVRARCSGGTCRATSGEVTVSQSVSDLTFSGPEIGYQGVMIRRRVMLGQGRGRTTTDDGRPFDFQAYGGWLDHSYFYVEHDAFRGGPLDGIRVGAGVSIGNATGANRISEGLTWSGVMVGIDVSDTSSRGNPIQGDAVLTTVAAPYPEFFVRPPVMNIVFSNIYDLTTRQRRTEMSWADVYVNPANGTFVSGSEDNQLDGRLYGPNHEEVGGVFERDSIVGAFGAKRQ